MHCVVCMLGCWLLVLTCNVGDGIISPLGIFFFRNWMDGFKGEILYIRE